MMSSSLQSHTPVSHLNRSMNTPEEDDETMSIREPTAVNQPDSEPQNEGPHHDPEDPAPCDISRRTMTSERGGSTGHWYHSRPPPHTLMDNYVPPPHSLTDSYTPPPHSLTDSFAAHTPFPSQTDWYCPHSSLASGWSLYPDSLHSVPTHREFSLCSGSSGRSLSSPHSTGTAITCSLEQPHSLRSDLPSCDPPHHTLPPYACSPQGAACWAQCCNDTVNRGRVHVAPGHRYQPAFSPHWGQEAAVTGKNSAANRPKTTDLLSLEQRKVFVTYEDDNDDHVNEVINFVALLRHNGFDTHIDLFEQNFRSISKIDFMERYLSEREYLIIIIISPKYYHTVTAPRVGLENDERTCSTVYIHKQLQSEFIQNGSKNFRFIPVLFPGAKKSHVPTWLQNTNIYRWPRDRDDILRRLMRVEKYNPPPIGPLPTIVSFQL